MFHNGIIAQHPGGQERSEYRRSRRLNRALSWRAVDLKGHNIRC